MSNIIKSHQYISLSEKMVILPVQEKTEKKVDVHEGMPLAQADIQKRLDEAEQILAQAKENAKNMVLKAKEEAQLVMTETKERLDAWWNDRRLEDEKVLKDARDEGYRQGFIQGQAHGLETVHEEQQILLARAKEILEDAKATRADLIQAVEPELVELSVEIARKIIKEELSTHQEKVITIVREALSRLQDVEMIQICVSPEDYPLLKSQKMDLQKHVNTQAEVMIAADYSISEGGCIIRTSHGSVDARVDIQLLEIKKGLMELLQTPSSS